MSDPHDEPGNRDSFDRLGQESMLRVNMVCDRLESAWQSGQPPSLVDLARLAASVPQPNRNVAIQELILVDSAHRMRCGLPCTAASYIEMFPDVDTAWLMRQVSKKMDVAGDDTVLSDQPGTPIPKLLGDYEIIGRLGVGGMGQVFRAVHKIMKRPVAIKIMHGQFVADPESRQRFEREVHAISRLSHPNIVTAHDAREYQGGLYLVTELVEGEDLSKLIKRKGPLRPREAVHFAWQAAKGLKYAHQQGIIHRDIKPSNLLLEKKKTIKVLDLGLARLLVSDDTAKDDGPTITRAGSLLGTANYMAPEQARSPLSADVRSDIYSLGCTLYFLLTGSPPFRGESAIETIMAHVEQPIPEMPDVVNGKTLSTELKGIVRRMMAKLPADRPASMETLIPFLENVIRQESTANSKSLPTVAIAARSDQGRGTDPSARPLIRVIKNVKPWMMAVVIVATMAVVGGILIWNWWPERLSDPNRSVSTTEETNRLTDGLDFDGRSAYIEFPRFNSEIQGTFTIEVAASPRPQNQPANLVTWAGPRLAALFINSNRKWGIAWFDGRDSHLATAVGQASYGEMQIVTAHWNGQQFQMWVNGRPVELESATYPLHPSPVGLFVGGTTEDFLPPEQGVRYFDGLIACVRIADGRDASSFEPASNLAGMRGSKPANILHLDLLENSGEIVQDRSIHRRTGNLVNARWVNP